MSSRLKRGDSVTVVMDTDGRFPWQRGTSFDAVLESVPQGPGDTFTVGVEVTMPDNPKPWDEERREKYHGRAVKLNGNSSALIGIYERKEGSDA